MAYWRSRSPSQRLAEAIAYRIQGGIEKYYTPAFVAVSESLGQATTPLVVINGGITNLQRGSVVRIAGTTTNDDHEYITVEAVTTGNSSEGDFFGVVTEPLYPNETLVAQQGFVFCSFSGAQYALIGNTVSLGDPLYAGAIPGTLESTGSVQAAIACGGSKAFFSQGGGGVTVHNDLTGRDDSECHPAAAITVDTTGFDGNLSVTDDTVQKVAQVVDDLVLGGHAQLHNLDSSSDHNGISGSENNFMALDGAGLPKDSGSNAGSFDTNGAATSAVGGHESSYDHTKIHDRSHAIDSTSDHTSSITPGRLLKADANGLPCDGGAVTGGYDIEISNATELAASLGTYSLAVANTGKRILIKGGTYTLTSNVHLTSGMDVVFGGGGGGTVTFDAGANDYRVTTLENDSGATFDLGFGFVSYTNSFTGGNPYRLQLTGANVPAMSTPTEWYAFCGGRKMQVNTRTDASNVEIVPADVPAAFVREDCAVWFLRQPACDVTLSGRLHVTGSGGYRCAYILGHRINTSALTLTGVMRGYSCNQNGFFSFMVIDSVIGPIEIDGSGWTSTSATAKYAYVVYAVGVQQTVFSKVSVRNAKWTDNSVGGTTNAALLYAAYAYECQITFLGGQSATAGTTAGGKVVYGVDWTGAQRTVLDGSCPGIVSATGGGKATSTPSGCEASGFMG